LVKRKRTGARAALLAAFALSGVLLLGQVVKNQGYVPFSDAPINYRSENLDDPIARLQKQLDRGEVALEYEPGHGYRDALSYQIVVNWFIAEHKSQGLFQTDSGKHQFEQFWVFEASGHDAEARAHNLAGHLIPSARQVAAR